MHTGQPLQLLVHMHPEALESGTVSASGEGSDAVTASAASERRRNLKGATVAAMSAVVLLLCWVAATGWGSLYSTSKQPNSPGPALRSLRIPTIFKAVHPVLLSPEQDTLTLPLVKPIAGYRALRDGGGLRRGKWTVPGSQAVLRSQQAVASAHHIGLQQRGTAQTPDRSSYFSRPTLARDPTENMVRPA